jgi:hypothetical protein
MDLKYSTATAAVQNTCQNCPAYTSSGVGSVLLSNCTSVHPLQPPAYCQDDMQWFDEEDYNHIDPVCSWFFAIRPQYGLAPQSSAALESDGRDPASSSPARAPLGLAASPGGALDGLGVRG